MGLFYRKRKWHSFIQLIVAMALYMFGYRSREWITPCTTNFKRLTQDNSTGVNNTVTSVQKSTPRGYVKPFKEVFNPLHYYDKPVKDIYYIKIHKTGSTTFQNIIYRYGIHHNLTFALFNCENAMPFPNAAWPKYLYQTTDDQKFNMLLDHAFFNPEAFRSYMSPGRVVVSLVRHPLRYLESSFGFHQLYRHFQLSPNKNTIETFLRSPEKYDKMSIFKGSSLSCEPRLTPSYTKNSMAYHLGYGQQFNDSATSLENFLLFLEKEVSFVLVLEKFDESLVLLRRMLQWSLKDISYLPMWSLRFHKKMNLHTSPDHTNETNIINLHRKWAPVDYAVYDHYAAKLDVTLSKQSQDFWDEVSHFRTILRKLKTFCISMCEHDYSYFATASVDQIKQVLYSHREVFAASKWNEEFDLSFADCVTYVIATMGYHNACVVKQIPSMCHFKARPAGKVYLDYRYCKKDEYIIHTFPKSMLLDIVFKNQALCKKRVNG